MIGDLGDRADGEVEVLDRIRDSAEMLIGTAR